MKKGIILFVILVNGMVSMSQEADFDQLLDSAKMEFKKDFDKQDYANAIFLLNGAIKINPNNAESRYFLGYSYSRLNSKDGKGMIDMNLDLTIKSSEQFELVNKLSPKYEKEFVILDPYSKITAEWGSMAMSYWHNNKLDSARWAFREGKRRGGFSDFILKINRAVLDECSQNSILISSGDNFTIPLWYLQIIEKYRCDISVIDISLLNTIWYPTYLAKNKIAEFDLPQKEIEAIDYVLWKDSLITIGDFSWIVKPSYYEQYLLRGDLVFMSLLRKNKFNRNLYFSTAFNEESRLNLTDYLTNYSLTDKLTTKKKQLQSLEAYKNEITAILKLLPILNLNSRDERNLFDACRYGIMNKISILMEANDYKSAKELFMVLEDLASETKLPFQDERGNAYIKEIRSHLN